jgi:hypothetical protein
MDASYQWWKRMDESVDEDIIVPGEIRHKITSLGNCNRLQTPAIHQFARIV